ncbi:MAG: hypothetical protein KGK08_03980 [Acidobacteriota bacterium]|nr:hypothetical protein [Acidobacteriota bacterium]
MVRLYIFAFVLALAAGLVTGRSQQRPQSVAAESLPDFHEAASVGDQFATPVVPAHFHAGHHHLTATPVSIRRHVPR